ncbi:hypothetical protein FANTH_3265 [Fusarium anthophilum]|uniref:Uncharacterized protein n=1 Tax=Fusarium anthophilum TaxID=48485 RepID=A0A8H4ZTD8_9HYPO|nr:hypothetical protein FANTH_3265 [Fusarium anthophilum]
MGRGALWSRQEWVSFEALQLSLVVKRLEEGRVLSDASTTWVSDLFKCYGRIANSRKSMIKELATTTLQLRSMRQRRTFTSTFYTSASTFRQKHGLDASSPVETTDSDTRTPPVPDRRARVKDESEVDIIDLPIREEPKETPEQTTEAQNKTNPVALQPQISITPPVTPQQSSPDTLDTSKVASSVFFRVAIVEICKALQSGREKEPFFASTSTEFKD